MAGDTPATPEANTPAANGAADASDLLGDAGAAEAVKPSADSTPPKETPAADAAKTESKPDAKAEGKEGDKPKAEEPGADLLANNDDGKTPEKADGQPDAKKDETPETYEPFKLPEGMKLDDAALASATPLFREAKLSQDQAQKLVSLYADMQAKAAGQQLAGFNQTKLDWQKSIRTDGEFGGDKFKETLASANSVLVKFGDADLRSDLREWGWANHPGLIKLLARVQAQLSPDTLVRADTTAQPNSGPKPAWQIVYGDSMKPKE